METNSATHANIEFSVDLSSACWLTVIVINSAFNYEIRLIHNINQRREKERSIDEA